MLAFLQDEPGADVVAEALTGNERCLMSAVNVAEVLKHTLGHPWLLARLGPDTESLLAAGLNELVTIEPFGMEDAALIPRLHAAGRELVDPAGKGSPLSLGDAACLALAIRTGRPALTAERPWAQLDPDLVTVRLIRHEAGAA
jgi:ribonuclease VapC